MKDFRIAAIALTSGYLDIPGNGRSIRDWSTKAADAGANLVVFPEAYLTAYDLNALADTAITRDSEHVEAIARLAEDRDIVISVGLLERAPEGAYVTQMFLGRGLRLFHRKCHRTPWEKQHCFAGDRLEVQDIGAAKIGTLICYDSAFSAAAETLVRKGAEILIQPSCHGMRASDAPPDSRPGKMAERKEHVLKYWRARAYDYSSYAVYVNHAGETSRDWYPGYVGIYGPDGEIIAENTADREAMVIADLSGEHLEKCRSENVGHYFTLADARPDLYR